MHRSVVGVLLILVVVAVVGCAAYDKAKDLTLTVRTAPQDFTLAEVNSGFEANDVTSEDWEDHADKIQSVDAIQVSYEYDNQSGAEVTISIYISEDPNLTAENVAASAKLLHQTTLPEGTDTVERGEVGDAEARELLKQYKGNFTVYILAESIAETVTVTINDFRVYGAVNADFS